jgi:co-chaperonin GroES (HSP10)
MKPTSNWVQFVEDTKEIETTKSGLIVVSDNSNHFKKGKAIKVGPGYRTKTGALVPTEVKPGDIFLFNDQNVQHYRVSPTESYLMIRDSDIILVFKK